MADMYDSNKSSSSSFPTRPVLESDDISLFLQHFLHSSSSFERSKLQMPFSSQPFHPPLLSSSSYLSTGIPNSDFRLSNHNDSSPPPLDSSSNLILSSPNIYFPSEMKENPTIFSENGVAGDSDAAGAGSVKRRKVPVDNDLDDYDCESEEGFEASDGPSKTVPCRNSSKRSRAAEVHNLSEKRRRSRINEKMKALQNLIPNSNKTDKASMLDEAIEYLKQLQLQVQMLSMRNGLSLHPLYLPGMIQPLQLPQMRMGFGPEGNAVGPQHMNIGTDAQPVNQDSSSRSSFSLSNQSPTLNQSIVTPNMSNLTHPETSFGLNSSIQLHQGQFPLSSVSEEMYREDVVPSQQLHIGHATRNASECLSFDARASVIHNTNSVDACVLGGSILSQPMLPQQDAVADQNLIQHLHRKKCSTR